MTRTLFIVCLVVLCLASVLHAISLPQNEESCPTILDDMYTKFKGTWNDTTETIGEWLNKPVVKDILEKSKSYISQAGVAMGGVLKKIFGLFEYDN